MRMSIGIVGISGRMGTLVAEEVYAAGADVSGGIGRDGNLSDLAARSDVVIDFTHASTVISHATTLAAGNSCWVLGTSGLSKADESAVLEAAKHIPVIASPSYAPGVNLILLLAEQLGTALPAEQYDAEILEMHHRQKVDAPSATALGLGAAVAAGRGVGLDAVMAKARHGHTGARKDGEIGFASLRGGQLAGTHNLIFTSASEQIVLTHNAIDRRIFATGAVRAALWLHRKPAGLYSMRDVLGLP